jgi:hypothetical protein
MGCVHTHQGMPTIEGWGSPSRIWSVVEKTREDNQKARRTSQTVNQMLALGPEYDKIQAWWASNILLENMLKRVWWCKHSEMEFWNWTICCPMSCWNEKKHAWATGDKKSHAALRCC